MKGRGMGAISSYFLNFNSSTRTLVLKVVERCCCCCVCVCVCIYTLFILPLVLKTDTTVTYMRLLFWSDWWDEEWWWVTDLLQVRLCKASGLKTTELSSTLSPSLPPDWVFSEWEEQFWRAWKAGRAGMLTWGVVLVSRPDFVYYYYYNIFALDLTTENGLRNPEGSRRLSAQSCVNMTLPLPLRDYGICSLIKGKVLVLTYWPLLQFNAHLPAQQACPLESEKGVTFHN